MPDRDKVIKGLECCLGSNDCDVEPQEDCPYKGMCLCAMALRLDVFALLKEQEAKPLRCKTCTMHDKTGFCHRWNIEVKDYDYCSFGAWKGC